MGRGPDRLRVAHDPRGVQAWIKALRCQGPWESGLDGPGARPGVELDWAGLASAAGAVACRAWEPGVAGAWRAPRARGQRRRHTITNGVDCDLVSGLRGGSGALSILPRIGLGPALGLLGSGGGLWQARGSVLSIFPHLGLNPL